MFGKLSIMLPSALTIWAQALNTALSSEISKRTGAIKKLAVEVAL